MTYYKYIIIFFILILRRKQILKTRDLDGLSIKERAKLLIVRRGRKNALPVDPPTITPTIEAAFRRATTGSGHGEDAFLVLKNQYQLIRSSNYETSRG